MSSPATGFNFADVIMAYGAVPNSAPVLLTASTVKWLFAFYHNPLGSGVAITITVTDASGQEIDKHIMAPGDTFTVNTEMSSWVGVKHGASAAGLLGQVNGYVQ